MSLLNSLEIEVAQLEIVIARMKEERRELRSLSLMYFDMEDELEGEAKEVTHNLYKESLEKEEQFDVVYKHFKNLLKIALKRKEESEALKDIPLPF